MTIGMAIIIVAGFALALRSERFRTFLLIVGSLGIGVAWWLADYGADKPQTLFYRGSAHPAFQMRAGDVCPADRHVWNRWCVK